MNNKTIVVDKEEYLFDFLKEKLQNKSKNNIKSLLIKKYVYVNNKVQTKYNYLLKKNDIINIKNTSIIDNDSNIKLDIIYEDEDIIAVNKPSGILTISTDKEKKMTIYHLVMNYVKKKNKNNKIFIVHRLDKDTSGVLLFAKNIKTKNLFQNKWNNIVIKRKYYAIVEGKMYKKSGTIKSYLKEYKNFIVYSSNDKINGKIAITEYKVIKENARYSLLDINIKTGRKNQIRVHLSDIGKPIIGDKKYGSNVNPINRLGLHAYELVLIDPRSGKALSFKTDIPIKMNKIM